MAGSASITPASASIRIIVPSVIAASVKECPEPGTLTVRPAAAAAPTASASSSRVAGRDDLGRRAGLIAGPVGPAGGGRRGRCVLEAIRASPAHRLRAPGRPPRAARLPADAPPARRKPSSPRSPGWAPRRRPGLPRHRPRALPAPGPPAQATLVSPAAIPWCRPTSIGGVGEHRRRRGEAEAGAGGGEHSRGEDDPEQLAQADRDHRHGADRHADRVGGQAPGPVGVAPDEGRERASQSAPVAKLAAITALPPPSASSRSGTSTAIAPNISEGTATSAGADQDRAGADRGPHLAQRLAARRDGESGVLAATTARTAATTSTEPKTISVPATLAIAPSGGPNSSPATAIPIAVPITDAALLLGGAEDDPGEGAGPGHRAGRSLAEAGDVEQRDLIGEAEGEAGEAEHGQPGDRGAPRPDARGDADRPGGRRPASRPHRRR